MNDQFLSDIMRCKEAIGQRLRERVRVACCDGSQLVGLMWTPERDDIMVIPERWIDARISDPRFVGVCDKHSTALDILGMIGLGSAEQEVRTGAA